jgi:hypothetical protein
VAATENDGGMRANLGDLQKSRERLAQLEALIAKEKAKLSKGRRNIDTKFKILIGAFVESDKEQLKKLINSERFKAFLSEKDRAFVFSAASELFPDVFPAVSSDGMPDENGTQGEEKS